MKKLCPFIALVLMLTLLFCSAASADVITALAIEINPEHLEKVASYARVLGYNEKENTLTVQLIVPEIFSWEDVEALKVGDSIYTDGQEVVIESILGSDWSGVFQINDGDVFLTKPFDGNGDYATVTDYGDYIWNVLAVIECPVTESLLFLDYINEDDGGMRTLPVVRTLEEFLDRLENGPVPFDENNVYVVFDGEGNLAAIHRFYVPWQ